MEEKMNELKNNLEELDADILNNVNGGENEGPSCQFYCKNCQKMVKYKNLPYHSRQWHDIEIIK